MRIVIKKKEYAETLYRAIRMRGRSTEYLRVLVISKTWLPILSAKWWYFSSGQVRSRVSFFVTRVLVFWGIKHLVLTVDNLQQSLHSPFIRSGIDVDVIPILLQRTVLSTRYMGS